MGKVRETLVQFGKDLGFQTRSYKVFGKRFIFRKTRFKETESLSLNILSTKQDKPPEKLRNIPEHLPVCSEGCDTYIMFPEEAGGNLPCGKCGAEMKPKNQVYG